ncbi:uncharacterized protein LOC113780162 [Coffea eugenioides]|uniref:uncharacterized protein LOC113780162 n=1 Tax=Coffea eugenioides TaxID=49369 RepID=UPI000F60C16E|nr:uncharacterized protein LOC113780162 [Coffea eugenioides]
MEEVRRFFLTLDLREVPSVGLLDARHIFIKLSNEMDFHRIWSRSIWYVNGFVMRIFKWSTSFHVDKEPSVAPVWFQLPKLPVHYFNKEGHGVEGCHVLQLELRVKKPVIEKREIEQDPCSAVIEALDVNERSARLDGDGGLHTECDSKNSKEKMEGSAQLVSSEDEVVAEGLGMGSTDHPHRTCELKTMHGSPGGEASFSINLQVDSVDEGMEYGELKLLTADQKDVGSDESDDGAEDDLPMRAGNLSPRLVTIRERDPVSTMEELNIESLHGQDKRRRKGRDYVLNRIGNSDHPLFSITLSRYYAMINTLLWNIRGVSKLSNFRRLKNIISENGIQFVAISEPKLDASEKHGRRPFTVAEGLEFLAFMEEAEVFDAGFSGSRFTWCNNRRGRARIWKRIDRLLINRESADLASKISVTHLARHPSEHAPLKVSFVSRLDNGPRPFLISECMDFQTRVIRRHQATRRAIQQWNKQKFGNVGTAIKEAENKLGRAEDNAATSQGEEVTKELQRAQAEINRAVAVEEQFWRQKARVKWLTCGDRNTRFFHAVVRQRRVQGAIHRVKDPTRMWVVKDEDIAKAAIEYFSNLFSGSVVPMAGDFMHLIPKVVTGEENDRLAATLDIEEIRQLVFSMDGDSAARPDGFTGKFFSFAWDVVAQDVYIAIVSFFCSTELPRFITSTSIVLLPKVSNPEDFSNFRPISLCNFFNKMLSRILVGRLALVIPRLISPQQTGFVKGRSITDNYLLAQELMASIKRKARGANVALKLDMTKAYDRMSWCHIITMLRAFGFSEQVIDMVWRLISNVWFSIIINGSTHGFFKSRFRVPAGCPEVTHLAFADDVLIFTNGTAVALKRVIRVLDEYQQSSGQLVNPQKSGYLAHPPLPLARRRVIEWITQFKRQEFPIRYLGFPLYTGRGKVTYFAEVCQAVLARVMSWKSRLLSMGEGDVGFRKLRDVYSSFSCKLWWNFRKASSLWAKFMRAKYSKRSHPCQVELKQHNSMTWRRMLNISWQTELSMIWLVNGGSCNFWYDNWLGSGAISLKATVIPDLSFQDFISNGAWDVHRLTRALPHDLIDLILQQPIPEGDDQDELVWCHMPLGRFTLASAFQEVRPARNYSLMHSQVWHHRIPLKISFFMARFLFGKIACNRSFGEGGGTVGFKVEDQRCGLGLRATWWLSPPRSEKGRFLFVVLPNFICWHIWKAWNKAYFEGIQLCQARVCQDILQDLEGLAEGQYNQRLGMHTIFQFFEGITIPPLRYRAQVVGWRLPGEGILVLNIDGCSKSNPGASGGGGVLHDSSGLPLFTFSASFEETMSLRAEVLALATGLLLCTHKGFTSVSIQVDSLVLIGILQRKFQYPWRVRKEVQKIRAMVPDTTQITHCYREANRVADSLANVGVAGSYWSIIIYDHFNDISRLARGKIRLDRIGVPSIRRRKVG